MESIFTNELSYILMILASCILRKVGFLNTRDYQALKRLMFNITLPCAILSNFASFERDISLLVLPLIAILLNVLMLGIGYLLGNKHGKKNAAFLMLHLSGYGIGSFAMPYIQILLGTGAAMLSCVFDTGNAFMCIGISYVLLSRMSGMEKDSSLRAALKRMFSSIPLDASLLVLGMYILNLRFPQWVYTISGSFGRVNTFMAMFIIGGAIDLNFEKSRRKMIVSTLAVRYGISALAAWALFQFMPYSVDVRRVLAILALAPTQSMTVIMAEKYGMDEGMSGTICSLSILLSLTVMTVLVYLWA